MGSIGVWSGSGSLLGWLSQNVGTAVSLLGGVHPADFIGTSLGLLIITPTATSLAGAGVLQTRLALIPGGDPALARRVRAQSAVSYGLGSRNTLTLSSLEPRQVSLALQREVCTLSGRRVERQEWVLPYDRQRESPEEFLCRMGALLLLDRTPT